MAVSFRVPASPSIHVYQNQSFLGADFTDDASTVDDTKSPNCINMIRSVPGKVRKRMGYSVIRDYGACVYGVHHMSATDIWLVHAGTRLYVLNSSKAKIWVDDDYNEIVNQDADNIVFWSETADYAVLYDGMAEHRSVSVELSQKLIILDGKKALVYDGSTVQPLQDIAYVPTLMIGESPEGGGTPYESLNLLSPAWYEEYGVNHEHADTVQFNLSFGDLDSTPVEAWVMNNQGDWIEKVEGTDFTVNRTTGVVTFVTAPGEWPSSGVDNVRIKAYRTVSGYADRINHCTICALFGIGGANDRLFVSGNPDKGTNADGVYSYINWDWFSQQYDPTYFPDTGWNKLGSDATPIMGYSIINNYLAAHKGGNEQAQSILLREGDMVDDEPTFKLINTLQGTGAVSSYCFTYLETEPLFLTKLGIYAVTAQDITGEKYAQNRSYYLDGKLLKEPNLENAFAYSFKDYYLLCINNHVYVLDGLQPIRTDKSKPYATRQYVGFYWENVPASCMFEINDELYFGATDGKVYRFFTDEKALDSYNDNGEAISCIWETADISEQLFYKNKTYRYLAIRCMPELVSSVQIWGMRNGIWEMLRQDETNLKYFSFSNIVFSKMSFSTDTTAKVSAQKVRLKKITHARFKFINENLNEPFALNDFAVEYRQNGNKKG